MREQTTPIRWLAVALVLALAAGPRAFGQLNLDALQPAGQPAAAPAGGPVKVSARIALAAEKKPSQLIVTADVAPGWHIYSITQKRGGPVPTKITLEPVAGVKVPGQFTPNAKPEIHPEPAFDNLPVETHKGRVTWAAPLELAPGLDAAKLTLSGKLSFQACDASSCLPPKTLPFTATLGSPPETAQPTAAETGGVESGGAASGPAGTYKPGNVHVVLHGYVEPQTVSPGGKARLVITAEPTEGWHIYALAPRDPQKISKPTLISLRETTGWQASSPVAEGKLIEKPSPALAGETDHYYEEPVTWTISLVVPKDAHPGTAKLAGLIGFHTCKDEKGCDLPHAAQFQVEIPIAAESLAGTRPLEFSPAKSYKQAADAATTSTSSDNPAVGETTLNLSAIRPEGPRPADQPLLLMMGFGFLGGLILNLMPCVLPVIGLKILSFVEQSGQHRSRVLWLNVWYSAGILAVFLVLATLPVAYHYFQQKQFGWGQQFAYDGFNITLTAIVFAMALSFLGVWEIPIPGFAGSSAANDLAAKEGVAGAFFKGALTTVLATPCSGPFLGTALAFALAEPPHITYAMFACIGLGMAFPYLLIGAFPRLIRFLPKPGAWMDTFKQIMGFVLLGTAVYLMTLIQWDAVVPTVALLIGLWFGCWWIGRTPAYAEFGAKTRAWIAGATVASIVGLIAFQWLGPIMTGRFQLAIDKQVETRLRSLGQSAAQGAREQARGKFELPWQTFSIAKLKDLTAEGKTVMLDFTADWCPTCQALKKFVLDTPGTQELVSANGIVPLLVDMTDFPAEEANLLETLSGGQLIPVLAIFPAGRPNAPIVLSNGYTQGLLLDKLREAGPSRETANRTALNTR